MKNLLLILGIISAISLTSCQKYEFEGPYDQVKDSTQVDTTTWSTTYSNGGTLPTGTGTQNAELDSTVWVLTKYVSAFATEYPNDTLTFISNTKYTMNGGAERNYSLANIPSSTNKELSFYYFFPFGGSHYSGQVGLYFVDDGVLNNIEFTDIQNSSNTIRAWFVKIN